MDVAITGTGISALLLARALVNRGCCSRIWLIGPPGPQRPHLLSYWSDGPTPFDAHVEARWSSLKLENAERSIDVPLHRFRYQTFRAQAWADAVRAELTTAGVEWVEARVDRLEDDLLRPAAICGTRRFDADWVFASHAGSSEPLLLQQRFLGWELSLPGAALDTHAATLLDFRTPAEHDFRFVYALPLGPERLFLEHVAYQPCDHAAALETYLRDVLRAKSWTVLDAEAGATPLFARRADRVARRVIPIGVRAGLAKTSTGYAIMRMWRDAERLARALAEKGRLPLELPPSAPLYGVADAFFVDLMRMEPERLADLLFRLFETAPSDAVLAFLDEQAPWNEQLQVSVAMPRWLQWWLLGERAS